MSVYEFKMIPAPERPARMKGLARGEDQFCATLTNVVNEMAADGWEYVRCEALPCSRSRWAFWARRTERQVFVFRRLRVRSTLLPSPEAVATGRHLIPLAESEAETAQRRLSEAVSNRRPSMPAATSMPVPAQEARPPLAPRGVSLQVTPRRVSDPAKVQRVKNGARRISVRPPSDPTIHAAE